MLKKCLIFLFGSTRVKKWRPPLLYNSGFDPAYSYLAPGFLLKALLVKRSIKEGRKRLDFLRGSEEYKYDLGGQDQNLYQMTL